MNFRENICKTLIMYQISQNKSIVYEDKTTLKNLKRGDVGSIDWIDAGDLSGGFQEKDAQLLVILSIVLNLMWSFNPLCV